MLLKMPHYTHCVSYAGTHQSRLYHNGQYRVRQSNLMAKVLTLHKPESHMSDSLHPGGLTSYPTSCFWPGKAVEDGPEPWDHAPMWETQRRLLASDWLSFGCCSHLGNESADGRSSSVSPPLCGSDFPIKINKSLKNISLF